jgi:hypothetical protein
VRKTALFLLLIGAMLAAMVLPVALAPASAVADINTIVWLNTAYKGSDPLLGTIQAYEEGSTATLKISIQNTTGETITIKGAKVNFDWTGGEYAATAGNYPATLANNESGIVTIVFTVPATSVASNLVKHSYTVSVDYDKEGGYKAYTQYTRDDMWGSGTVWHLQHGPVDPSTVQVYVNGILRTDYTLDCDTSSPMVTFTTSVSGSVNADFQVAETVDSWADGVQTSFQLFHYPVVAGTLKVYSDCTLTTAYTLDADTGRIKFTTAPVAGKYIIATYQYVARWPFSGTNFAVYSADQNSAMAVKQQLAAAGYPGVATAGSREKMTKAAMEEQLGDQKYAAGNLDEAKAHYDQALAYFDKALKNDKDPNTFKALEPTGTLLLGIGMVLLALGVIIFVLRRPKGPSGV